ncbi:MAG: ABC transporter ATP-binding protein [Proteobacteria bacterium]|nr:ABC transporter ATP-binding protein [Pseudomonadota bacterium]
MFGFLQSHSFQLIWRLWQRWIRHYKAQIGLSLALMGGVAVTTSIYPLVIQWTVERIGQKDTSTLFLIPLVIIGVTSVRAIVMFLQTVATTTTVNRIVIDIQKDLYRHLLNSDLAFLQRDPSGTLTSRFTVDVEALRNNLNRCLTGFVRGGITVVALVGMLIYLDPLLTLMVFVAYPVAGVPVVQIGKRLRSTAAALQASLGGLTAFLQQSFTGVRMIKSYHLEDYESAKADQVFGQIFETQRKAVRLRARVDPLMEVAGGWAVAGVLAFGTWRVMSGTGTVGSFTGYITALLLAAQPIRSLGSSNAILQDGLAAAERLFALLDTRPKIVDKSNAKPLQVSAGKVELKNVWFSYAPDRPALQGMSLRVESGKTTALVGRSGGGKSTVFNLIARLYDVGNGAVVIDEQDVRDITLASLREGITLVSQDVIVFNDTVRVNIAFGKTGAIQAEIEAAARAAEADEFITRLPQGYDTPVGEQGGFLSGGQKQRLVLARAFLRNSPILLLDEATSALDAASEELVQKAVQKLSKGRTTLVIAHRLATVRHADIICVIDQGQLVEQGTHEELLKRGGAYAELHKLQFKG